MQLTTKRLTLRPVVAEDREDIRRIWASLASSPYAKYDQPADLSEDTVRRRIDRWAAAAEDPDHRFFAVVSEGTVIGFASFNRRTEGFETGYAFRADVHGRGFASESMAALVDHMLEGGAGKIIARTALENTPSVKLLRALGFSLVGTEQVSFYKDDHGNDIFFEGGIFEYAGKGPRP